MLHPVRLDLSQGFDRVGVDAWLALAVDAQGGREGFDLLVPLRIGRGTRQERVGSFHDPWVLGHEDRGVQTTLKFMYCSERRHCRLLLRLRGLSYRGAGLIAR